MRQSKSTDVSYRYIVMASLALTLLAVPTVAAAGPPTQLYGKSISVTWAEGKDRQFVSGEKRQVVIDVSFGVYVSTNGRVFARGSRTSQSHRTGRNTNYKMGRSHDPTGGDVKTSNVRYDNNVEWRGRTMIRSTAFESGARRVTVNFDESFRSCTVNVSYGKEAGAPGIVQRGMDNRLTLLGSVSIAAQSCRITDGNIFGEGGT